MNNREIENFVKYSIQYQIVLAQRIAKICNTRIYVFDSSEFFTDLNNTKIEVIDGVRTAFRDGRRAVLSIAAKQAFGTNVELFLRFVENNVQKDNIGLYVIRSKKENKDDIKVKVEQKELTGIK